MDVQVEIVEDHGHSLLMSASHSSTYPFMIDGKFSHMAQLGREPTWVRHPPRILNGTHRHLMVTDTTGVLPFFSTYLLMPSFLTAQDVLNKESRAPYPLRSGPMLFRRYTALKTHLASGLDTDQQQQLTHILSALEGGLANTCFDALNFKQTKAPLVSVVIPVHCPIQYIYRTLCSLLLAYTSCEFEVILIDCRKPDTNTELKVIVSGATLLNCLNSEGFIQACNRGVAVARGKYVTLLSDTVEVTTGWLDALVGGFERVENVGMVGSKLIGPDGDLLAAGHIAGKNGDLWPYGHGQNPWEPRFCYARQTDYLSSAALMTTRKIWDDVKGLSTDFAPMTFEDADLSFKIRAAGYSTWFIPNSVVALDQVTSNELAPDDKSGALKQASKIEFKRRWITAFNAFGSDRACPDIEKDRGIIGRILFFDHATPRPDRDAGSYAALQEMRLIQSLGYKVVFMPSDMADWGSYTKDLERMGVEVIRTPFFMSPDEYLLYHATDFDAFYITRFTVAEAVLSTLRQAAPDTPVLLNIADLHFLREMRAALVADDLEQMTDARKIRKRELAVMQAVDVVLSYTDVEHTTIHTHSAGQVKTRKCPWVVEMPDNPPPSIKNRAGLSFLGGYTHKPNAEAVLWFADQVMPALSRSHPNLCLHIYGANMPDELHTLTSSTINPAGYIKDVADAYDPHLIFIAPLQSGAGIKGKVLAALAHGIPCILSPLAAEGIGVRHGHECLIADSPAEWSCAIAAILGDPSLWARLSENGRALVGASYTFEKGQVLMRNALQSAGLDATLPQQTSTTANL
jgi:GT2 family glycosyltransferase